MDTQAYITNPDRLLVEIGFAGSQYGLIQPVVQLSRYLGRAEKTRPASIMILGVLSIATKDYEGAISLFKGVQTNPAYSKFCAQAKSLETIATQISATQKV